MPIDLTGRSFLRELDFTVPEWHSLLDLAGRLKGEHHTGSWSQRLTGTNIAVIFEKASTRTRTSFEVAAHHQGAHVTYLDPSGSHLGHKESAKDSARVLGRLYEAIEYRGAAQATVESLAEHAGVPVWNGLTDEWHPTQSLCDVFTMREHANKPDAQIALAYIGDARNNVASSLLMAGAMMGMDVRVISPASLASPPAVAAAAARVAATTGARILHTSDPAVGVRGVDFVYTDVWLSMGEPESMWKQRIDVLLPYQVDRALFDKTGTAETRFMHCLPAMHNRDTEVGERIFQSTGLDALEVTEEIFESDRSIVFQQAENRMHTIKAVMVATLGQAPG